MMSPMPLLQKINTPLTPHQAIHIHPSLATSFLTHWLGNCVAPYLNWSTRDGDVYYLGTYFANLRTAQNNICDEAIEVLDLATVSPAAIAQRVAVTIHTIVHWTIAVFTQEPI